MQAVAAQARTVLSAPVQLTFNGAAIGVKPKEMARLLDLPSGGETELAVDQKAAARRFRNVSRGVARPPRNADFAVNAAGGVRVVPSRAGRQLDVAATSAALLAAASRTANRSAELVVVERQPRTTTKEARALRIERQLASYTTLYSGTSDRINNLQLAINHLDGARIAPGATWSFNERVGPRTEERGFRSAPVIINGEYEEGVGGGVSQVATTVFNAAWEAGIKIAERTAHALYISRYPTGRDATVNYPDVDLKLRNDTKRWIVIKAGYDESGIIVRLLGAGPERRVESIAGELETTGPPEGRARPGSDALRRRARRRRGWGAVALRQRRAHRLRGRRGALPGELVHGLPLGEEDRPRGNEATARASSGGRQAEGRRSARRRWRWRRWWRRRRRRPPLALDAGDRLGEPGRHACGAKRLRAHARVPRPAVRDDPGRLADTLDDVLEAEAGTPHVGGAHVDA